jgi:hypothetical protein
MHHGVLAWEIESLSTDARCVKDLACRMKSIKCLFDGDEIGLAKFGAPNEITEVQKHREACDDLWVHIVCNCWDIYLEIC